MNLYLLERTENTDYGEAVGFVVMAVSEAQARELASKRAADEGPNAWLQSDRSSCARLDAAAAQDAHIVLGDFRTE